jgi:bacillithiol biosynthesis cysteine-adding enzyme BshC
MTLPRVVTEDLDGSPLARAAIRGELTRSWYAPRPAGVDAWRDHAAAVAHGHPPGWVQALAPAFDAAGAAERRLDAVANGRGVVVTSGQQPGLFGGPIYCLTKALSAVALANAVERETGVPAAPVFWAATDDADFDEASHTAVVTSGGVTTLQLGDRPRPGTPMSLAPLGDVAPLVHLLEEACGSAIDPSVLAATREAYTPGATVGGAYVALLRRLFRPLGVAVLDASHPAVRDAGADVLRRALERAGDVEAALLARSEEIVAAGFEPQVEAVAKLSLVFATIAGEKRRVPMSEADAARRLPADALSPNVLLRPVVERAILPTVGYLAGPGEIAYFAQVGAVADVLEVRSPVALPRWSATLLEPRVLRILDRIGAEPDDLQDPHALETRLARAALPAGVAERLRDLRTRIEEGVAALEVDDEEDLVPPASLQALRGSMLHRLARVERRYAAAVKRREEGLMRDVATVRAALYPNGVRQERILSFIPYLARYGMPLVDELLAHAGIHASAIIDGLPGVVGRLGAYDQGAVRALAKP